MKKIAITISLMFFSFIYLVPTAFALPADPPTTGTFNFGNTQLSYNFTHAELLIDACIRVLIPSSEEVTVADDHWPAYIHYRHEAGSATTTFLIKGVNNSNRGDCFSGTDPFGDPAFWYFGPDTTIFVNDLTTGTQDQFHTFQLTTNVRVGFEYIPPPYPPASSCTISVTPSSIVSGGSATLAWSTDASFFAFPLSVTPQPTSSSMTVSPVETTTYTATVTGPGGFATCTTTLEVSNRKPKIAPIGNKMVSEGQLLQFTLSGTDPDGDALTYSASNLPAGAVFDSQTRTFTWIPSFTQAGNYPNIEFTVMDDGSPMLLDFEDITITVGDVNRSPIFPPTGSQQVLEHNLLSFTVWATDPDGDAVTLAASGMPPGAIFNSTTGLFSWTPVYPQAGVYTPTFTAADNGVPSASSTLDVVITVGSNPTPTEQVQTLVDTTIAANLPNNVTNSYLANLNKVGMFIDQGKTQQAINNLNAFIQKVEQDYLHGTITLAQRDSFVALAQDIISELQ